ncbi:hypothetical protein [Mucilaginibacter glaciei]|uniref:Dolichyl-phosphate-mannose-protein mannosyltransferase n=1 Tax=Mucilaginibacter glaciei TaxID=2772109 RepID=A0A926NSP6_9SPHI|nr:hypothetical protein [Mucilaginibacter glaciei]MBD1393907.1 hypothetical protein [Mucilaginibacter glaciei]
MRISKSVYLLILTGILVIYYLVCAIYLHDLGYYNQESLFYIEKAKIVFEGLGNRLKVMGLTAPITPFYAIFVFTPFGYALAPILASAMGTAGLFYVMASSLLKNLKNDFYLWILLAMFLFHPGLIYSACSGKGIYMSLIFFFLFFINLFKFYKSNTTFHVSIASICLVTLIFCDYKFIWLTLFFLPLVLSITVHSLKLGEQESIFRLYQSINSPSLRRKLVNKTFSLYIILFALPLVAVLCYKLLNLTHASDLNYFNESPYATWNVLVDKLSFDAQTAGGNIKIPEISILLSARVLLFCPMIIVAVYLLRESTYQVLTILTPFALIEFLHIKYDKVYVGYQYYLLFIVLAFLCVIIKHHTVKNHFAFKIMLGIMVAVQIGMGGYYLKTSSIPEEKNFVNILFNRTDDDTQAENMDVANYIASLPGDQHILIDDATAYPIVAFTRDIRPLIMPYESSFLSALESPDKYADYIVIATAKNVLTGYTQLNNKYIIQIKKTIPQMDFRKVFETKYWVVYRVIAVR